MNKACAQEGLVQRKSTVWPLGSGRLLGTLGHGVGLGPWTVRTTDLMAASLGTGVGPTPKRECLHRAPAPAPPRSRGPHSARRLPRAHAAGPMPQRRHRGRPLHAHRPHICQVWVWGRPRLSGDRDLCRGEEQGTWASRTRKRSEAGWGRPEDGGVWTAKPVKRPPQQPAQPPIRQLLGAPDAQTAHHATTSTAPIRQLRGAAQRANDPRHIQHSPSANHWAPRTRKRHQQEHRPQRPTESSDPTRHAKGTTDDCPGPRKETTTRRNVTRGGGVSEAKKN